MNFNLENADFIEQMYTLYQEDAAQIDPSWRSFFEGRESKREEMDDLGRAYRTYGHLLAKVNPIAIVEPPVPAQLQNREDPRLQAIYCDKIGFEYMHISNPELEQWIQERIETKKFQSTIEQKKMILNYLNKSELFEVFLHTKYTGQKRFSIEGGETLIPMLASVLENGAAQTFVIGMAHRGRLNVLSNILQKSYATIFSEFEEGYIPQSFEGSGDVKYHKGFSSKYNLNSGKEVEIFLTPNPSHLEGVDPVVEGQTFARQNGDKGKVLPILIHGDAAIAGQGVVYETLQLSQLRGYATGGTLHIVINNQIGFTTLPEDARSTFYCTDIAKAFNAPVFHVNAEDPEGCVFAVNLALEIRQKFGIDVFVDLNCYRKYGHNESDEPAFTQPIEYQLIKSKRPIREIYRDALITQGVLEAKLAESLEEEFKKELHLELEQLKLPKAVEAEAPPAPRGIPPCDTAVSKETLIEVTRKMNAIPAGFNIHKKLERLLSERTAMVVEDKPIDWGMGEMLAYATLLNEGREVRLTGQDCGRGTFSHRHALWMDQVKERAYFPLKNLGNFEAINSPLSEYAPLGFEFGYSAIRLGSLVIWEAQFGDFSNGAQVMIDQFISSAEQKWGQKSNLVLLLPHGYEGQGPEHSSARIERFLTLCGDDNLVVTNPTTPAQMFHLLRRQLLAPVNKPLIVFTPKGLLRHPECISRRADLEKGSFQTVLNDGRHEATTLIFCSGRVYYDLLPIRKPEWALIRIEQLYPLPKKELTEIISGYKNVKNTFWVQEEPANMGAWNFIREHLPQPKYCGRESSASPATGSFVRHKQQFQEIVDNLNKWSPS